MSHIYILNINIRFGKKVVDFLEAYVAELVDRPPDHRGLRPVIGVEEHIHGEYVKVYMDVHVYLYMHVYMYTCACEWC